MQGVASRGTRDELTAMAVKALATPGLHRDAGGLYLQVQKAGQRSWIYRYTLRGRTRDMGLGGYPAVSLAEARRLRDANRALVVQRIDPLDARRAAEPARHGGPTFREVAEAHIAAKAAEWSNPKHGTQWAATLKTYAYPAIGSKQARDVGVADMLAILTPIWETKNVTATRVRCRIEAILGSASVREGWADYANPAAWRGRLSHLLAAPSRVHQVQNHPALPYGEMAGFMRKLRQVDAAGARALEWTILTMARTGMTLGATWAEVDVQARAWTVPAARMKGRKGERQEFRIPLSDAAIAILDQMRPLRRPDQGDHIFPSPMRAGQHLSNATMAKVLDRLLDDGAEAEVHGFRATARTWGVEVTQHNSDTCEVALAHKLPGGATRRAYGRGDVFEKRRVLMDDWSVFLATGAAPRK